MGFFGSLLKGIGSAITGNPFGVISSVGSLASSIAGTSSASKNAEKDREFTREENQKNRDWQESMWNKQNEYNTPQAQIGRLQAAGLNPALAYGSITDGAASSAGTPSTSSNANPSQSPSAFANMANQFTQMANLDLIKSQAAKNYADADKAREDTKGSANNNKFFDATYSARVKRELLLNDKLGSEISLTAANLQALSLANEYNSKSMQSRLVLLKKQIAKLNSDIEYQDKARSLLKYNAETQRISANASKLSAEAAMYVAPAMAFQLMQSGYYHQVLGDYTDSEANYALAIAKAFEANANGDLTLEKCDQIFVETFNLSAFGDKNPGSGSNPLSVLRGASAIIYGAVTGKAAFGNFGSNRARHTSSPFSGTSQARARVNRRSTSKSRIPKMLQPPKYSWQK